MLESNNFKFLDKGTRAVLELLPSPLKSVSAKIFAEIRILRFKSSPIKGGVSSFALLRSRNTYIFGVGPVYLRNWAIVEKINLLLRLKR